MVTFPGSIRQVVRVILVVSVFLGSFILARNTGEPPAPGRESVAGEDSAPASGRERFRRWLIDGRGEAPLPPPGSVIGFPVDCGEGVEEAGIITEVMFYRRFYPDSTALEPEFREQAHATAVSMTEPLGLKREELSSPPSKWTLRGPVGMERQCAPGVYYAGRITALDYSANGGMYFGSAAGGLWGPAFSLLVPLTDDLPSLMSGAVAVHPTKPDTIYYGTGVYSPQSGGGGAGLYRSTDNGKTWPKMNILITPQKISRILIAPWNPSTVFVSTSNGIFRSEDDGENWEQPFGLQSSDIASTPYGSVLLSGQPGGGIWRSTDQGDTWKSLPGLPMYTGVGYIRLAISQNYPNIAYVAIAQPLNDWDTVNGTGGVKGIYRTTNLLDPVPAWTDVTPTTNPAKAYMGTQGWFHNSIAIHPTDPNIVFAGSVELIRSTNGGSSWSWVSSHPHPDTREIFFRPGDHLLYTAGDGGVFTSSDLGATWSSALNEVLPVTMFYNIDVAKTDDDVVFGATQDNSTSGTSAGYRSTWKHYNIADGIDVTIDWSDEQTVFTTTQFGDAFRTTNGGADCPNWPWLNKNLKKTEWSAYVWQEPGYADWIYLNGHKTIYYSSNKGSTWGKVNPDTLNAEALMVAGNTDGTELYAIVDDVVSPFRRFHYDGPGSFSWTPTPVGGGLPGTVPLRVVTSASHPGRVYVFYNGTKASQRVYRTTNSGSDWTNITGNFPSGIQIFDLLENPNDPAMLWAGTDMGVFRSSDGGANWWWWNDGMPDAITVGDLAYAASPEGDYVLAGTFGRSMYERAVTSKLYSKGDIDQLTKLGGFKSLGRFILAAGDSGRTGQSTDGGKNWVVQQTPVSGKLSDVHLFDSQRYLAVGAGGTIVRTTNGGVTWTQPRSPSVHELRRISFPNEAEGYAAGDSGVFLRTFDGGETWEDAGPGIFASFFDVSFADPANGILVGHIPEGVVNQRIMFRTSDGGNTWSDVPALAEVGSLLDLFFVDQLHGFCTRDDGVVLRTTDGGESWVQTSTGSGLPLLGCFFADPLRGWVCGIEGKVFSTTDGGDTWNEEESGTTETLTSIGYLGDGLLLGGETGIFSKPLMQPTTIAQEFEKGWNLISLPLSPEDSAVGALFPSAVSAAYSYNGRYDAEPGLRSGPGYWLKFGSSESVPLTGYRHRRQVIDVVAGWNLIGSISTPVGVDAIAQYPEGTITSQFFGYAGGYNPATAIEPFRGYWVKAAGNGQIVLDASAARLSDQDSAAGAPPGGGPAILGGMNLLKFTDASGVTATLFYTVEGADPGVLETFDLPPPPPGDVFDVRFGTGNLVGFTPRSGGQLIPIRLTSEAYPLTITWDVREAAPPALLRIGGRTVRLEKSGSSTVEGMSVCSLLLPGREAEPLPSAFALRENYPNPFNPGTTIQYELPEPEFVTLSVFTVLGQEVRMLVSGEQEAGYHSAYFDARDLPSGIYICRIKAGAFTAVRKMVFTR